jgi:hypothetical protein
MATETPSGSNNKMLFWFGCVASAIPVLMLVLSITMKFMKPPGASEGFQKLGWDENLAIYLAITEIACTVLYVIPQTAVLGAILLTGYLGGATATHVRVHDDFYMPIVLGVLIWLGLFLRDARLRKLIPIVK